MNAGPALFDGELGCEARVHFPGTAGITEAAVRAAAAAAAPTGTGRLRAICSAISALADASEPLITAPPAVAAAAAVPDSGCAAEAAAAADQTAPLQLFSNPLYSVNTPKQVC